MAFHRRKLLLVSFSCGGGPMDIAWVVLDDGAKREVDESVVRALMVLDWVEAEVMVKVSMGSGSLR